MTPQPNNNNDTALVRGVRTGLQTSLGVIVTFFIGLFLAVWNVPGVPMTVLDYMSQNFPATLAAVGIPSGIVAFIWNVLRKDVKNW